MASLKHQAFFALSLLGASSAFAQAPATGQVTMGGVSYSGGGCPIGTASAAISPDNRALTIFFDQFQISSTSSKQCTLDVAFNFPPGWSYTLFRADTRGYAQITAGETGGQSTRYSFGASQVLFGQSQLNGPFADNYVNSTQVDVGRQVWSPCAGATRNLSMQTTLTLRGNNSLITVDSVDAELGNTFNIQWRRCTGINDAIGPLPFTPSSEIRLLDPNGTPERLRINAFPGFAGGARVALGDIDGDSTPDVIAAAGPGGAPHVRIFSGRTGAQINHPLGSFYAYATNVTTGVNVASGDVDGDGRDDLITAPRAGNAGPHVRVLSGATGQEIWSFFAYDQNFRGGVFVAVGDVNGDGRAEIITGAGTSAPHVVIHNFATRAPMASYMAYPGFSGGVSVAAGDVNGDGLADVITGPAPGSGGGPHIKVMSSSTQNPVMADFYAFESLFLGGVSVSAGDIDGDRRADIIVAPGTGGGPRIKTISGATGQAFMNWAGSFFAYEPSMRVGVNVAGYAPARNHSSGTQLIVVAPTGGRF